MVPTIDQAREHLGELVDAAVESEQIVLKRGARRIAAIVPLEATLTDAQAQRLWRQLAAGQAPGKVREFATPETAGKFLRRTAPFLGRRRQRAAVVTDSSRST
jgi:prevent-host-death family protein